MQNKKIRIGQIGVCHEHARGKMDALLKMPDVFEIVGVVDDRKLQSPKFPDSDMKLYEGLPWVTEEEMLNIPGLQAVTVETPNDDLVSTAIRCMEKGLAMHMDKPAGTDLNLFENLLDGCSAGNIPFQMGYMFRNNPAIQLCMKAVREKWLGDILEIQAGMSHNYGGETYQEYLGSFPGGIMFNLGCHLIDFVVYMLGRPDGVTPFLKPAPGCRGAIKNNCLAILEYPHAAVTLRACSKEVDGLQNRRLRLCGTKGTIELCPLERFDGTPLTLRLTLIEGNDEYEAGTHDVNLGIQTNRYRDQLFELAQIILGEIENPFTCEHDYLVHEVILAASDITEWRKGARNEKVFQRYTRN